MLCNQEVMQKFKMCLMEKCHNPKECEGIFFFPSNLLFLSELSIKDSIQGNLHSLSNL